MGGYIFENTKGITRGFQEGQGGKAIMRQKERK